MKRLKRLYMVNLPQAKKILISVALILVFFPILAFSQQNKPNLEGDYSGALGPLKVNLHLKIDDKGVITGNLDSPNQGAMGIPCADFLFDGQILSFTVPTVQGSWKGTVATDGKSLDGTWKQGSPTTLKFERDSFEAAEKPSRVDGIWLGAINAGNTSLLIQLQAKSDRAGKEYITMDSLDQRAMGIQCTSIVLDGDKFTFEVPAVNGRWTGNISADNNTLTGTWNQARDLPLNFKRQQAALSAKPVPPPSYQPALLPVKAEELQSVLDKDIAEALKSGALASGTGLGVSIGVVKHGVRRVFSYGAVKPDSIFEIGSISKTFTGLILSQMVEQGKVKLDEPVRDLLPPGIVAKPEGSEITLLDLATQHSGLPRMPDNFAPADPMNPYADYHPANLYAYMAKHGVARPESVGFLYSNLGLGLLGQALANRANLSYPDLLKEEITGPLGLMETVVSLSLSQKDRFAEGHDGRNNPAHAWDLDAFAGAGAIRSTASDMLAYLEANLHPESIKSGTNPADSTMAAAIVQQQKLRADASPGMKIGLAWLFNSDTGEYWHNGATGGYSAYAFFNPEHDYAAVVLFNATIGPEGSFADRLGQHISQRLAGKPAISLVDGQQ